jgi:replication factor A1
MRELITKISALSSLSEEEVLHLVDEKKEEFSGMISEEGAAYIVAKELGLNLLHEQDKLKIKDLKPGMNNIEIIAKITNIIEREYSSERGSGVVCNIFLEDETSSVKAVLWNNEIDALGEAVKGDTIRFRGYTKKDNLDEPELRLGYRGSVEKLAVNLELSSKKRVHLNEASIGGSVEIRAAVLQVFESGIFYEICPDCHSRLKKENSFICEEHGSVKPDYAMVISCIIDDGSANARAVFFGSAAESLISLSVSEAWRLFISERSVKPIMKRVPLGTDFIFQGHLRTNKFFDRPEFIVNGVKSIDVKNEIEMLLES